MSNFEPKTICILGRQPALGVAELESIYGSDNIKPIKNAALLNIPADKINFKNLGGTIKVARILSELNYSDWQKLTKYLVDTIPAHLEHLPEGKFTLGLSVYGINVNASQINRSALQIKKVIKKTRRPVRVVPNKTETLNSAQVLHNKLTHKGAWELLFIANGSKTLLAQTMFVQDIEAYAARDQARPKRDPKIGMLPPKLAQIIINLAVSRLPADVSASRVRILDPFCGTGVILQEALLMGYSVLGTDIDRRMVEYAKTNMQWLAERQPAATGHVSIELGDAADSHWARFTTVASEAYLGRPFAKLPPEDMLKQNIHTANKTIKDFLQNLSAQIKQDRVFCLAIPAWRKPNGELIHLPVLDKLTDMGYNKVKFKHVRNEDLIYYRENQIVARELLILNKVK
ncbi:MAG TPA: hypothetical protein VFB03_03265 [Candidatus Saccharimonadales bacterium]|nr:hypothetical protein [Candidatus Saccharimonadales bacterium]